LGRDPEPESERRPSSGDLESYSLDGRGAPALAPSDQLTLEAPVAIYSVDLEGRVLSWNPAAETLFGWSADEIVGRPVPFLPPDHIANARAMRDRLLVGEPITAMEYCPVTRDGRKRHVLTSASLIRDEHHDPHAVVAFALDVTEKHAAAETMARAEAKWRLLLQSTSDTITLVDARGYVRQTTGEFTDILGYEFDWWPGRSGFDLIHPDDLPRAAGVFAELLDSPGETYGEVLRTRHSSGHWELIEYTAVNRLDDPLVEAIVITTRNITDLTQTEALLADEAHTLELIARGAPLEQTLETIVRMVDYHTGGDSRVSLLDQIDERRSACAAPSMPLELVDTDLSMAGGYHTEWSVPIEDTRDQSIAGSIAVRYGAPRFPADREREVLGVASHLAAIAVERDRSQRHLEHQARHDQLTGLPNRWAIVERLDDAITSGQATGRTAAVQLLDLDRFKVVNESLGHEVGDELLLAFGQRLRSVAGDDGFVGHFGGDEFVVIVDQARDVEEVLQVANRIDHSLQDPFTISIAGKDNAYALHLSASIGVALPTNGDHAHEMLQHADTAMNRAKDRGRDRVEIFDHTMQDDATELLRVDRELRLAVERSELSLRYQPKVDLRSGRVAGVEALLRWHHPDRGLVLPSEFIGVAEETGLIVRIGAWVLDEAVRQARSWVDGLALDDFCVAVNVSARQLSAPGLVGDVADALRRYDWPAPWLTLELTESILVDDADASLGVLEDLEQLGVRLAIDDFGTGYSSLRYLHRFPVDIVKVDRAFVTSLTADGGGSPVATAVVHMARALGFLTAAEGVEKPEQLAGLRALGCDWAQGFLFAEPLPPADLVDLLRSVTSW